MLKRPAGQLESLKDVRGLISQVEEITHCR